MANSLTEYLTQMQELTKKNFDLLQALNNSFYTKSEHLSVTINDKQYVIPSFLSLENKLNTLQDNFEHLVNAPRTGDACFDFNGNTQEIQLKGFTNTPCTAFENLDMETVAGIKNFGTQKNEIFKDFLTPTPYIKIDLKKLPDDIHQVNVKKIAISNSELVDILKETSGWIEGDSSVGTVDSVCRPINYSTLVKKIYNFEEGKDYISYDKIYTLPIRYQIGAGKYVIKAIERNWTDENFNEHYILQLDNIIYKIADETIERNLQDGHYLITNNDKVKLLIESVNVSTKTVQVIVENGGFADLCTENDGSVELSTLKYFAVGNINNDKYLNIPLEEDQYILVFLAPIQRNSLIQSAWSDGLFFNVYGLTNADGMSFEDYYNTFVTNIGDKLFGIVAMAEKDFVNVGEQEFKSLTESKPAIDTEKLNVTLINKHMSNSETISEIYNLYKQKEEYKKTLNNVQKEIDDINGILSSMSFEDTDNNRTIYTDQLTSLNERKKDLVTSITSVIQQITTAATDTDTPVENPKYHIRGFFDYNKFIEDNNLKGHNVIKIEVQYRYKNANRTTGNAESIGDDIFSDWNIMNSHYLFREPVYNGNYKYEYPQDSSNINVPSFNQFDIAISQGETVDIRLRVVYSVGFPYVKCTSDWSEIVNVEFPVELRKNITVLDIIKENNDDVKKEQFKGLLDKMGVSDHVSDTIIDENITFLHSPDRIASGFYTQERRVIPLRTKLQTLTDDIKTLEDEIFGNSSDNLNITLSDGTHEMTISPMAENHFNILSYKSSAGSADTITPEIHIIPLTLNIQNNSSKIMKLYSLFPGNMNNEVSYNNGRYIPSSRFSHTDYYEFDVAAQKTNLCLPIYVDAEKKTYTQNNTGLHTTDLALTKMSLQHQNQWIYFRLNDVYNGDIYYINDATGFNVGTKDNVLFGLNNNLHGFITGVSPQLSITGPTAVEGLFIYPHITNWKDICITPEDNSKYKTLRPGESLQIPISANVYLTSNGQWVEKTMSFDLRTSLYSDPVNYKFTIRTDFEDTITSQTFRNIKTTKYNPVVINN